MEPRISLQRTLKFTPIVLTVCMCQAITGTVQGGVAYSDPGWDYIYTGDLAAAGSLNPGTDTLQVLDGQWRRNADKADAWDGSAPGVHGDPTDPLFSSSSPAPGGIGVFTEGSTTYIRMQDTGHPNRPQDNGMGGTYPGWSNSTSNKRFLLTHKLDDSQGGHGTYSETVLNDGITISFRARIPATGPLDDQYPFDGSGVVPWPAGGVGYPVYGEGRGMFTIVQNNVASGNIGSQIGFSLIKKTEIDALYELEGAINPFPSGGLTMNALNGSTATSVVDTNEFASGVLPQNAMNMVEISDQELNDWHEFWITIKSSSGSGSHEVKVYMDGSLTPESFFVTHGGPDFQLQWQNDAFLMLGLSNNDGFGSVDVDFFSYSLGVLSPQMAGLPGDYNGNGTVDAGDYVLWRNGGPLVNEVHNPGTVSAEDYMEWRARFGNSNLGSGNGLSTSSAIPEPAMCWLITTGLIGVQILTRSVRRSKLARSLI